MNHENPLGNSPSAVEKEPSSSSDSDSTSDASGPIPTISDFLWDISSSVDKLVQISRAIRKASAQSNSAKAEAYEEWENAPTGRINKSRGFEEFIGVLLEYRYRYLHINVRQRVQKAISRCNRRIAYQRRHQRVHHYDPPKKGHENLDLSMAKQPIVFESSDPSPLHSSTPAVGPRQVVHLQVAPSLQGTKVSASTLSPNFSPFVPDDASSVSAGSSVSRMTGNPADDLPPPPALKGSERYFQCPYCCLQLPRKRLRRRAWTYVNWSLYDRHVTDPTLL